ncbi:MAG: TolC family protein [Spirochaetota bacterium]
MKLIIQNTCTAALLMVLTVAAGAEESVVAYQEYMKFVRENLPEIRAARLESMRSETGIKRSRAYADPRLSVGSRYQYDEPVSGRTIVNKRSGVDSYAGVSRTFGPTGTKLGVAAGYGAFDVQSETGDYASYQPTVSLTLRQPVMKNFLGMIDRIDVKNSKLAYEIARIEEKVEIVSYEYTYSFAYMQWCAYMRLNSLSRNNVSNAWSLYRQTVRKMKAGVAENDDVQKSYSMFLRNRITQNDNQKRYREFYYLIAELVSREKIVPEYDAFEATYEKARNQSYGMIPFQETRQFQTVQKTLESYRLSHDSAENAMLPQLDLTASVERWDDTDEFGRSLSELDRSGFTVGFELTYPLGNTEAEADFEYARLSLRQLSEELRKDVTDYYSKLRYTVDAVEKTKETISLYEQTIRSLRSQYATESRKYEQIRLPLSTLLETQQNLADAESSLVQTKLDLVSLYYTYIQLTQ